MTTTALPPAAQDRQQHRPVVGGVRILTSDGTRPTVEQPDEPGRARPGAGSIEALLTAADASSQQRIRTKATRLREAITELRGLVERETETKAVEARVLKLREQLATAENELRTLRTPSATSTTAEVTRAVRAWAKTQGIEVNGHGRVPNDVIQQWQDATGGVL